MTLLDRILARGVQMPRDPMIAARVERHVRRIQPDPMFRRRLRGQVLNRYVANREGMIEAARPASRRREMGALGRGVLFASMLTALSVGAVGAAVQESLPGDALYSIKLQLEGLRMQIAPPGLRDDLAAKALDERLEEVERLAAAGRWELVDAAAAGAARAQEQLAALMTGSAAGASELNRDDAIQKHAERIEHLIATAPASARDGLRRAVEASTPGSPPAVDPPAVDPPAAQPPTIPNQGGDQPPDDAEPPESRAKAPAEPPAEPGKHSPKVPD
jgi:hypothetical protein